MPTRRIFIKQTGISALGTALLVSDPFINAIAKLSNIPVGDLLKQVSHSCEIIRSDDFLYLRYYFVNLKLSRTKLSKVDKKQDAFIIVRVPQQHVGEEVHRSAKPDDPAQDWSFDCVDEIPVIKFPDSPQNNFSKSFIAGFSYLSFKVKERQASIRYQQKSLIDWNQFDLLTLQELETYPNDIPVKLSISNNTYPVSELRFPFELAIARFGDFIIPLTIIEAPYKIFLSPIAPFVRPHKDTDYRYQFSRNNSLNLYYPIRATKSKFKLTELWSNDLIFQITPSSDRVTKLPPAFKIVAYDETPEANLYLLPTHHDRSSLAQLTNIQESNRDVSSKYFNMSSFGVSTFFEYFNLDEKQFRVVGWKQEIKLGRDNYVEITEKAIDARSTLKVLVSDIAERRIEQGKSVLIHRRHFEYLENEKEFVEPFRFNNYLFTKIISLAKGSFYVTKYAAENALGEADGFGDENYFIPRSECNKEVMKMPYRGIQLDGNEVDFQMDLMIIRKFARKEAISKTKNLLLYRRRRQSETVYFNEPNVKNALRELNNRIIAFKEDHKIEFKAVDICYAPPSPASENAAGSTTINSILHTQEIQFYSVYIGDYEQKYPLGPNLKFASVKLRHLEGIETVQGVYSVCFSSSFNKYGLGSENKTGTFLQIIKNAHSYTPVVDSNIEIIINKQKEISESIRNLFTENYRNAGSLVNPDIVIDNISVLRQGISLTDELNSRINDLNNIRPADILRGMNVELLGGIDLKKILDNIIPIADSPQFEIIEEAIEGASIFKEEYESIKRRLQNIPNEITALEIQLQDSFNDALKTYIDNYNEARGREKQLLYQIDPAIKFNSKQIHETIRENELTLQTELKSTITTALAEVKAVADEIDAFFTNFANNRDLNTIIAIKQILDAIQKEIDKINKDRLLDKDILKSAVSIAPISAVATLVRLKNSIKQKVTASKLSLGATNRLIASYSNGTTFHHLTIKSLIDSKYGGIAHTFIKECLKYHLLSKSLSKEKVELTGVVNGANFDIILDIKNVIDAGISLGSDFNIGKSTSGNWYFELQDNIDAFFELLNENFAILSSLSSEYFKLMLDSYNDVIFTSRNFIESERAKIETEINLLHHQINHEVRNEIDAIWNSVILKAEAYRNIKEIYFFFRSNYLEFLSIEKKAKELESQLGISLPVFNSSYQLLLPILEEETRTILADKLNQLLSDSRLESKVKDKITLLRNDVHQLSFENTTEYIDAFHNLEEDIIAETTNLYLRVDSQRQRILSEIEAKKYELQQLEGQLKHFLENKIKELENQIVESNKDLIDAYRRGEQAVNEIQRKIQELRDSLNRLRAINKREVRYTWKTNKFNDVNLGILKFIVGKQAPTELRVEIKNTIRFDVASFPPQVKGIETEGRSFISNFSINFLNVLSVEFDNVSFTGGSKVAEKFDVAIRDVRFEGPLNFVQVFQRFLKTIDKGLRFDTSATGALLGYEVHLPDIIGGAFNFVNWKLMMQLKLPFSAGVPMRMNIGLNSPQEMGLVTGAIWGGRGCLIFGLEPKRGVVSILLIIEVGVVLYINLGVAEGIVYIFAGIYIKKEYDNILLKGYLTCGGVLNILGIITACVTFYMGLQGNGNYLEGYCTLSVEIKICAFIKISVGLSMYKRIYGSPDNSQRSDTNQQMSTVGKIQKNLQGSSSTPSNENLDIDPNIIAISDSEWDNFFSAYYR